MFFSLLSAVTALGSFTSKPGRFKMGEVARRMIRSTRDTSMTGMMLTPARDSNSSDLGWYFISWPPEREWRLLQERDFVRPLLFDEIQHLHEAPVNDRGVRGKKDRLVLPVAERLGEPRRQIDVVDDLRPCSVKCRPDPAPESSGGSGGCLDSDFTAEALLACTLIIDCMIMGESTMRMIRSTSDKSANGMTLTSLSGSPSSVCRTSAIGCAPRLAGPSRRSRVDRESPLPGSEDHTA